MYKRPDATYFYGKSKPVTDVSQGRSRDLRYGQCEKPPIRSPAFHSTEPADANHSTEATVTIVAACVPVLHPLYDRARTRLRKIFPGLSRVDRGNSGRHPDGAPGASPGGVGPDSPGFWSLKLRAIGLAESWWSSTAGRTSRRSGVRGGQADEYGQQQGPASGTAISGVDGAVVVHCEGAGREDLERPRDVVVSVDGVVEMSDIERGTEIDAAQGPEQDGGGHATAIGPK